MTDEQTTTDHIRIIAEAAGWDLKHARGNVVIIWLPGDRYARQWSLYDFAAHAVAWAAGRGIYVRAPGPTLFTADLLDSDGRPLSSFPCDPTDPHDTARATLAAIAEAVWMLGEGGE